MREIRGEYVKLTDMDQNRKVTTKTASGKVFYQTVGDRIDWCNRTRSKLLETRTIYEDIVFSMISKNKKKYAIRQQRLELDGHIYFADIYIDRWKIIIEVDGGYHKTAEKSRSDKVRDKLCSNLSIRVFRITNDQVMNKETLMEFMKAVNECDLPSRCMRPLNERQRKYIANPDFAANGITKKSPRIYEYRDGGCKSNSIRFLRRKKLIEPSRQA